jgi:hypothetical protein
MLRFVVYLFLGFLALFLESTIFSSWPSATLRLNFVWIIVLFLGFTTTLGECGVLAICLGLMGDIAGAPFLGFFATIYFSLVALLRGFIAHIFVETLWARLLWVGIFSLLAILMEWGLLELVGGSEGLRSYLLTYALPQAVVSMVLAAIMLPLLDRLDDFIYNNISRVS